MGIETRFRQFCEKLIISSKDLGMINLSNLYGSQSYLLEKIFKGLDEGKRFYVILKARQLGITTITLALDLFWAFNHTGVQGALISNDSQNRDFFRQVLNQYYNLLPPAYKIPAKVNNRDMFIFKNLSQFIYMVNGERIYRGGGSLGRGKAFNFIHGTECSSYRDEQSFYSLMASTSDKSPQRLYIFESTAKGFNLFYDIWTSTKKAVTQEAIFIGWWRREDYRAPKGSKIYNVYWDDNLTSDEKDWKREVKRLYDYDITDEQIAWWRWNLSERFLDDIIMACQEYPWTEDIAFIVSGSYFFSRKALTEAVKKSKTRHCDYWKYKFGYEFIDTEVKRSIPLNANLKIWEYPDPDGVYAIGADPAFSANPESDKYSIQVLRCYGDKIVQVAEFCASGINSAQFAWVLAHLGGAYKGAMINLEINGGGQAVLNELFNLQRFGAPYFSSHCRDQQGSQGFDSIVNALGSMMHYLYHRIDSAGKGFAYHWKTTHETKGLMFNLLRSAFENNKLEVYSEEALEEMKYICIDNGIIESDIRRDDRVIALALAVVAYEQWIKPTLIRSGSKYHFSEFEKQTPKSPIDKSIINYLKSIKA